ncbi:MAG: cysteine desulfurase [Actinomycetia bacterium]|nr:cysteine desulfurase [Actinomycetes bacterium]MCP4959439.1 cysteine desulfurase [Actinomycetes bacterium]
MASDDLCYLDHAASTPLRTEVFDVMVPYLRDHFGNPSGAHRVARDARRALEEARDRVAEVVGSSPHDVVFTSGGTESDNLAVRGFVSQEYPTPVCPATEHHAVLDPVEHLDGRIVRVDSTGRVDLEHLAASLDPSVGLVSVMAVNNETGTIADLASISDVVRSSAPQAILHCDAVQAANWLDLVDVYAKVDALSLAGHKIGGPKGVGVLVVSASATPRPMLLGGGQEHERRSGTQNVAGAVGFAAALLATTRDRASQAARVSALSDRLVAGAIAIEGVEATVGAEARVPGICHLTTSVNSEDLLILLDREGVMASAASSCASGALNPSHVLLAMGRSVAQATGALRLSMSHGSDNAQIDRLLEVLPPAIETLRAASDGSGRA